MTQLVRRTLTRAALAVALVLALAGPAAAADPVFAARTAYFTRFKEYWSGLFKEANGITLIVIGCGIVSLFIITRGKWRK